MFFKNTNGLLMDTPYNMEQIAYDYAIEVYSISDNLMNLEGYNVYELPEAQKLRARILKRYPDVITDSEYLAKREEAKQAVEETKVEEIVKKVAVEKTVKPKAKKK